MPWHSGHNRSILIESRIETNEIVYILSRFRIEYNVKCLSYITICFTLENNEIFAVLLKACINHDIFCSGFRIVNCKS